MHERLLFELHIPHLAEAAARRLIEFPHPDTRTALTHLIRHHAESTPTGIALAASAVIAALESLCSLHEAEEQLPVLAHACRSPHASVRKWVVKALRFPDAVPILHGLLRTDVAWTVRQEAIKSIDAIGRANSFDQLIPLSDDPRWGCLAAIDDPHWRVRNDLLQALLFWSLDAPGLSDALLAHPSVMRGGPVVEGFLYYYQFAVRLASEVSDLDSLHALISSLGEHPSGAPTLPAEEAPWWNDDPPVLRDLLEQEGTTSLRKDLPRLLPLLTHEDPGVRRCVAKTLRPCRDISLWRALLRMCEDPRHPYLYSHAMPLLSSLNEDRKELLSRSILGLDEPLTFDEWCVSLDGCYALGWALTDGLAAWCEYLEGTDISAFLRRLSDIVMWGERLSDSRWRRALLSCLEMLGEQSIVREHAAFGVLLDWLRHCVVLGQGGELEEDIAIAAWLVLTKHLTVVQSMSLLSDGTLSLAWKEAVAGFLLGTDDVALLLSYRSRWWDVERESLRLIAARALTAAVARGDAIDASTTEWLKGFDSDPSSVVRAAALTPSRAQAIVERPSSVLSWHVRLRAAQLCQRPQSLVVPEDFARDEEAEHVDGTASSWGFPVPPSGQLPLHPMARELGPTGLRVAPLGISGHYGLPEEGFQRALDAGANLYFWEPNYNTQTRFFRSLPGAVSSQLATVAGTFESTPKAILRDIERALSLQGLEQIKLWLIFWVRDWQRLSPEVIGLLEDCQREGKIHSFGMSTHQRPLALRAIEDNWDVVMVRHNAAHRGAEEAVFPAASAKGTGILTFNNLIYGRILRPLAAHTPAPPSAPECYRYSLSQPGVCASFTAPYDLPQLHENLDVLEDLSLTSERRDALRAYGDIAYRRNRLFADCVRNR